MTDERDVLAGIVREMVADRARVRKIQSDLR